MHNAIEIEMPVIRILLEFELQFIAAGAKRVLEVENETK